MLILGVESSCDETAAAVLDAAEDRIRVLSSVVSSQIDLHARYGGVVPELASRAHLDRCVPVIREALSMAGRPWPPAEKLSAGQEAPPPVDAIAVTRGPGLIGALLVGLQAAKALAWTWDLPLVGVNHLTGHLQAMFLDEPPHPEFPFLGLVVSGGHTSLYLVRGHTEFELLGATRDDAAGEAFDKAAKMLGLGYPGGVEIQRHGQDGDREAFRFPRAMPGKQDFSFSGLKTSCRTAIERLGGPPQGEQLADFCASFQEAIVDALWQKVRLAHRSTGVKQVLLGGGVVANSLLREVFRERTAQEGMEVFIPPTRLCTDNAAMIACAGYRLLEQGVTHGFDLNATANLPL